MGIYEESEDQEQNIYSDLAVEEMLENDGLSHWEAAFMRGYLLAEEQL